jgi:hypothetical protein
MLASNVALVLALSSFGSALNFVTSTITQVNNAVTTTSTVTYAEAWPGTTVEILPTTTLDANSNPQPAMPTLIYNCAHMQYICKNIDQFGPRPVKGLNTQKIFHYDRSKPRQSLRRNTMCSGSWTLNNCGGITSPALSPDGWNSLGFAPAPNVQNIEIAPIGVSRSGRKWSCDEYPPAS